VSLSREEDDERIWSALSGRTGAGDPSRGLVWRVSVPPSSLGKVLGRLRYFRHLLRWQAGVGDGRLRVFEDATGREISAATLRALREMRSVAEGEGGSLVVEREAAGLGQQFDVWGLNESAALLMKRVKEQLDPDDTLSPGRFGFNLQSRS
jgi:FAD/FMN-containing dehydrogenase